MDATKQRKKDKGQDERLEELEQQVEKLQKDFDQHTHHGTTGPLINEPAPDTGTETPVSDPES